MAFKEVFDVKPSGEETKMEVNVNAFTAGNELGQEVKDKLSEVQGKLDKMQDAMKGELNTDELKVANMAIEKELEASIPDGFASSYDAAESWVEAAEVVQTDILTGLNYFMKERLDYVIKTVDAESWTSSMSKDEAGDVIQKLNPTISPEDLVAFKEQYSPMGDMEKGSIVIGSSFAAKQSELDAIGRIK